MTKIIEGAIKTEYYPKIASTAVAQGSLVELNADGQVAACTSASTTCLGRLEKAIVATDADYALASLVPVQILGSDNVLEATVTGTFATTNVGDYLDLSTALIVDAAASTTDLLFCTGYVSSTVGRFKIAHPQSLDL